MSGNQGNTHWDEHEQHDGQSSGDVSPLDTPDDVLHASFEEVELEPASKKSRRGGINPRLLAVLMMVVVVGAAGYAFMKMKSRAAAVEEPLSATMASTDPVQQSPGSSGSIGMPMGSGGQGSDLLGGVPPASAPVQPPPTFVPADPAPVAAQRNEPPAFQPAPQAPQMPTAPAVAPAPPPGGDAAQMAAMVAQLQSMQTDANRMVSENAQLRLQLKAAEDKLKEPRTTPKSTAERSANKQVAAKGSSTKSSSSSPKRGGRIPEDQILTESRESRFAAMSVRAIYPLNGRNARAWVNVGNDLVEVSAGSTIDGAMVKYISPEAMEVVTDAGVIRAQR